METTPVTSAGSGAFPQTRWTLVIQAASPNESLARKALEELCESYWYPIYSFLRRSGRKPEDAEDLTQGFFAELLAGNTLSVAKRERGRLRSFLLGSLKRFLARDQRHAKAWKRGGKGVLLSLDHDEAEVRYAAELVDTMTPDLIFEKAWANGLVLRAKEVLRQEFAVKGRDGLFAELVGFLSWDKGNAAYRETAARLQLTETNLRTSVYRMRRQYREVLEREIADTVETIEQAQEELQHLLDVLGAA